MDCLWRGSINILQEYIMAEFNTKPIEEKLNRLGKELQSFFEHLVKDEDLESFNPKADLVQTSEGFEIYVDLPGMNRADVTLSLADQVLTVKGRRTIAESADQTEWVRRERRYGTFSRTFPVPAQVSRSDIKATFRDGVLTVRILVPELGTQRGEPIDIE
jgi:HSP20 family protein